MFRDETRCLAEQFSEQLTHISAGVDDILCRTEAVDRLISQMKALSASLEALHAKIDQLSNN